MEKIPENIPIETLVKGANTQKIDSSLGFFSKPYRVEWNQQEWIVKTYPVAAKNSDGLIALHDNYAEEMRKTGILIPDTRMIDIEMEGNKKLIVLQPAFAKSELVRGIIENAEKQAILDLLKLLLDDALVFWKNKPAGDRLGFHPTLRNYALHEGKLYYFDTFPPMNMEQEKLNKIILEFSPVPRFLKWFTPIKSINRVSDEYYSIEKMLKGLIGSTCRLRIEHVDEILAFSRNYINASPELTEENKKYTLALIAKPPQLSPIWLLGRRLFGKPGQEK